MEKIQVTTTTYGNYVEITPVGGIQDNSTYEIMFIDLKDVDNKRTLSSKTVKTVTALTPAYASLESVQSLISGLHVPEEKILYHIREASKFAAYIKGRIQSGDIPFELEQFVRYKAAHDSLLAAYIDMASESHTKKGQLGDVAFESQDRHKDIYDLLKYLKGEIEFWKKALQGYKEGIAKPLVAMRGKNATPPMTDLGLDFSRGM